MTRCNTIMAKYVSISVLLLTATITGCASDRVNKTIYDAANARNCVKETGGDPNCHPEQPTYDEYKRQREELSK